MPRVEEGGAVGNELKNRYRAHCRNGQRCSRQRLEMVCQIQHVSIRGIDVQIPPADRINSSPDGSKIGRTRASDSDPTYIGGISRDLSKGTQQPEMATDK